MSETSIVPGLETRAPIPYTEPEKQYITADAVNVYKFIVPTVSYG